MSIILLDDPDHASTSLLSGIPENEAGDQLQAGQAANDGLGDAPRSFALRVKQNLADINTMFSLKLGSYLLAVPPAGVTNDWDPTDGDPAGLAPISRLDLYPSAGNAVLTGLLAAGILDEKEIWVSNVHPNNTVALAALNDDSEAANQFRGPGGGIIIEPYQAYVIRYYAGSVLLWVIRS